MLSDFDFSALDDPTFKEDAVREEIIAPILRRAGYMPTGSKRVQRSKPLKHPFVMIGSKKHPVSIVPDYTLFYKDKALMIVDAKAPTETIANSVHVEQAYSYAIHPEVRCQIYGLCNGRHFSFFHTGHSSPLLLIATSEIEKQWDEVERYFSPTVLNDPDILDFYRDFGLHAHKAGLHEGGLFSFEGFFLGGLARVNDRQWTVTSTCSSDGIEYMISFDLDAHALEQVFAGLPNKVSNEIRNALERAPFWVDLEARVIIDCNAVLCPSTRGPYEPFAPFEIVDVFASRYDPTVIQATGPNGRKSSDTPDWVFKLSNFQ